MEYEIEKEVQLMWVLQNKITIDHGLFNTYNIFGFLIKHEYVIEISSDMLSSVKPFTVYNTFTETVVEITIGDIIKRDSLRWFIHDR